jgi:hypothetical protein
MDNTVTLSFLSNLKSRQRWRMFPTAEVSAGL